MSISSNSSKPSTWTSTSHRKVRPAAVVRTVNLTALALLVLIPLVWTVLGSFKNQSELAQRPPTLIPRSWHPENYSTALTGFDVLRYLSNSVIVVVVAAVGVVKYCDVLVVMFWPLNAMLIVARPVAGSCTSMLDGWQPL